MIECKLQWQKHTQPKENKQNVILQFLQTYAESCIIYQKKIFFYSSFDFIFNKGIDMHARTETWKHREKN